MCYLLINGLAVILGSLLGPGICRRLKKTFQQNVTYLFASITAAIGISLLLKGGNLSIVCVAVILGMMVGSQMDLDGALKKMIDRIQVKLSGNSSGSKEGQIEQETEASQLLASSFVLMVCSTSGMVGAMTAALTGDFSVLFTKAMMDLAACICFSAITGPILAVTAVPVLLVLFLFYGIGSAAAAVFTEAVIADFCACGGIIQLLNAIKMASGKDIAVINVIPALVISIILSVIF